MRNYDFKRASKSKPLHKLGKDFEEEIAKAFKPLRAFHENGNRPMKGGRPIPICDRVASIPVRVEGCGLMLGLSCLVEAKEVREDSIGFDCISDHERSQLNAHYPTGGLTLVLIKRVDGRRSRCWGVHWEDWRELEAEMGFAHDHDHATLGRRKAGTASVSLEDGLRPVTLIELAKLERLDPDGHRLGWTWDLRPLFPAGVWPAYQNGVLA